MRDIKICYNFQEVGAGVDAYLASILVGLTRFLCSMVNTWLLRRYKRRSLCIISSIGMALCMIVSGYFTLNIKNGDRSGFWVTSRIVSRIILLNLIFKTREKIRRDARRYRWLACYFMCVHRWSGCWPFHGLWRRNCSRLKSVGSPIPSVIL